MLTLSAEAWVAEYLDRLLLQIVSVVCSLWSVISRQTKENVRQVKCSGILSPQIFSHFFVLSRKRSESGPKLEELFTKLENRLAEYEDRSSKKFSDLNSKIGVMNSLLENHKKFLEELTDKKNRTSEEKVKNLFEKVYSQDTVCREEREENTEKFDQLQLVMNSIEKKFETEVGNVEEKFKTSIAIVLEELQGSITKVDKKIDR